ncbi:GAF domain-containing protein [Clostridium luticellarii]|jgi:GAF domain-containing protein|uniref:GAF domain-containing protein n=1 Tax=Clostridium luticellarii TaxID=1691940 RepID=A0A2T0BFK6_9CLOT|nr:GAF domain-containing protein [Clostridium luticellarii]MCI1946345.1 GAF domain-containing protein [Clostridium luticellarii]MCI1969570.1 GAF domain-containing protein [Clostridium luticellarii]MCI1994718.1 GAF domain-containing protein [Clostridium luticellarii]MCI2038950.1 GAF domain-containing protein [Clostridium luticellarii]PRR82681.1 hypothetical protein CLLU_28010 [Clostridium luticellarii]
MNKIKIKDLLETLKKITGVDSTGIHRIQGDRLYPVSIIDCDKIDNEGWKSVHKREKVSVSEDPVLKRVVKGHTVVINDVAADRNSSPEFKLFGIKSIAVFPLFKFDKVVGIAVIPSLDKKLYFDDEMINRCEFTIKEFDVDSIL